MLVYETLALNFPTSCGNTKSKQKNRYGNNYTDYESELEVTDFIANINYSWQC